MQYTDSVYQYLVEYFQSQSNLQPTRREVRKKVEFYLTHHDILLPEKQIETLVCEVDFLLTGLGPLEFFLRDESVSEILVNSTEPIIVERSGKLEITEKYFLSESMILNVLNRIIGPLGKRIDLSQPMVDARLPDGSRINAIIPPLSVKGPVLTIRKFPSKPFDFEDLKKYKTAHKDMIEDLKRMIADSKNILISGGTGSGKTSTLNACVSQIPREERLITIEDAAEIQVGHPHWIRLESRTPNMEGLGGVDIRSLLRNALRMRPDRIIVGEIRGEEALDMLQALNTGHRGSLTTIHANSCLEALYRLETMVLASGMEIPLSALRPPIVQAIDYIIQQERLPNGQRIITAINRVNKAHRENYTLENIWSYDASTHQFIKHTT